jgi:aminopeptidase-like protein
MFMVPDKSLDNLLTGWDSARVGAELHEDISVLYPFCRSITGDGLRKSIRFLQKHIPLTLCEVPSGTQVFDWVVPKEWNIRDAYIKNARGERVIDFRKCNLHVLNYSTPVR